MPHNKLLFACGFRRGLINSNNHLKHFYEASQHIKHSGPRHMLASGLHRVHKHMTHKMHGHGAQRRLEDYERPIEGNGLKYRKRPSPLHFKM